MTCCVLYIPFGNEIQLVARLETVRPDSVSLIRIARGSVACRRWHGCLFSCNCFMAVDTRNDCAEGNKYDEAGGGNHWFMLTFTRKKATSEIFCSEN